MSGRRQWIARFVLVTVSVALVLGMGEWIVGRVAPQNLSIWDMTRDGMTVHRANVDVYLPRYGQRIRTNSLGMRDEETSRLKSPASGRILVLGDSFMEALQVPFEASLPSRLESKATAQLGPTDVINLSVSGWGTDDQVTYLERIGMDLEPDLVLIMMTLHNDVSDNSLLEFHTFEESGLMARPAEPIPFTRYMSQKLKAYLAGSSQIYQLAYQTSVRGKVEKGARVLNRHVASLFHRETDPVLDRNWKLTLALLDKAFRLVDSKGASLLVGLIPLRIQLDEEEFSEVMKAHGLGVGQVDLEAPQRRVRGWAEERGVPIVDLLPTFSAHKASSEELLYLPEDGHWSSAGHALAVDTLMPAVRKALATHPADH